MPDINPWLVKRPERTEPHVSGPGGRSSLRASRRLVQPRRSVVRTAAATGHGVPLHRKRWDALALAGVEAHACQVLSSTTRYEVHQAFSWSHLPRAVPCRSGSRNGVTVAIVVPRRPSRALAGKVATLAV
jgi:hypothetical protein